MAEVFLCETGQLTQPSKVALRKAGIVVAEVADINKALLIRLSEIVGADDMLWAALDALNSDAGGYGDGANKQREKLAANLLAVLLQHRKPTEPA
jgi:hypothetical protein